MKAFRSYSELDSELTRRRNDCHAVTEQGIFGVVCVIERIDGIARLKSSLVSPFQILIIFFLI